MSILLQAKAWKADTRNPSEKLVLLKLADNASDEGFCWPSVATIQDQTQLTRRTVIRAIKAMKDRGMLETIPRFNDHGRQRSNAYQLRPSRWGCQDVTPEGDMVTRGGCHGDTPEGDMVAPLEPPDEPPREPSDEPQRASAREVFHYWRERLEHPNAKFGKDKATKIQARLNEGYTVEELKQAVDGCAGSDWHRGDNDRGRPYDGIDLIFRNSDKVDQFMKLAEVAAQGGPGTGAKVTVDQVIGAAIKPETPIAVMCAIEIGSWNLENLKPIELRPYAERCIAKLPEWKQRIAEGDLKAHELQAMERRGISPTGVQRLDSPTKALGVSA